MGPRPGSAWKGPYPPQPGQTLSALSWMVSRRDGSDQMAFLRLEEGAWEPEGGAPWVRPAGWEPVPCALRFLMDLG